MHILLLLFAISLFAEDKITSHLLQLESGPLTYTAVAGSLPVRNDAGEEKGQISYIAYFQQNTQKHRPLTFAFNGGPGSSSVWLHLGTFGPRRIVSPEEGQSIAPPYQLVDNLETLLDLSDLVFIDPISTGLSRANTPEDTKIYCSVDGDIESVGDFIRDFLTANKRWNSPLYIAGESYGTFRAAGVSHYLQDHHGIYLNGLILISCAIDFQTLLSEGCNSLPYFLLLPTYVTTAWYHDRYHPDATLEEVAAEARQFAYETYAPMLVCPRLSCCERETLYEELAFMTGLPYEIIKRERGKIDLSQFAVNFFPGEKKTLGRYDTRCVGDYISPYFNFAQDPSVNSILGLFTMVFHDYLQNELECPASYQIISEETNSQWDFHSFHYFGMPQMMGALQVALTVNPSMKLFVGCGYFDCATPFAATEYFFQHLDLPEPSLQSIQMEYYEGGHMYYLNPLARKKFKQDLVRFYSEKLP